ENLRGPLIDAWDGVEPLESSGERRDHDADLGAERLDGLIEVVNLSDQLPDEECMVGPKPSPESLPQRWELLSQLPARQVSQEHGIGRALDETVKHRPARHAEDVRGDGGELDASVLQHLMQAVRGARTILDECLARTGEIAQFPDRRWRHKASPQQPVLQQLSD